MSKVLKNLPSNLMFSEIKDLLPIGWPGSRTPPSSHGRAHITKDMNGPQVGCQVGTHWVDEETEALRVKQWTQGYKANKRQTDFLTHSGMFSSTSCGRDVCLPGRDVRMTSSSPIERNNSPTTNSWRTLSDLFPSCLAGQDLPHLAVYCVNGSRKERETCRHPLRFPGPLSNLVKVWGTSLVRKNQCSSVEE